MGVIQELEKTVQNVERAVRDLSSVSDLLETEMIDSKTASELIRRVLKTIAS